MKDSDDEDKNGSGSDNSRMLDSFDSEDLIEISKYYEKKQNFKSLKSEI